MGVSRNRSIIESWVTGARVHEDIRQRDSHRLARIALERD